jgi:anti-sigma regulatory factor (Ser/Thr protein kinase)
MTETEDMDQLAEVDRELAVQIPATPGAPAQARRALRELLEDHPLASGQIDTITLLVSELVTNSVTHPRVPGEIGLSVAITPVLTRVIVSDPGPGFEGGGEPPAARSPDLLERGGGFGLALLDAAATRWGTLSAPGRFSVWFEVDHGPGAAT